MKKLVVKFQKWFDQLPVYQKILIMGILITGILSIPLFKIFFPFFALFLSVFLAIKQIVYFVQVTLPKLIGSVRHPLKSVSNTEINTDDAPDEISVIMKRSLFKDWKELYFILKEKRVIKRESKSRRI